jgi:hypothetical protein
MTLTTHAIIGASVAELFPQHYILAFVAGFISHLVIDSLPHFDYQIKSSKRNVNNPLDNDVIIGRAFIGDLLRIGFDACLGVLLAIIIFMYALHFGNITLVLIGAVAGILPDPLQFIYWKTRSPLLLPLQKFHIWIQKGKSLHIHPFYGLLLQFGLVVVVVAFIDFAHVYLKIKF